MSKGRMSKIEPECNLMQHITELTQKHLKETERMPEI